MEVKFKLFLLSFGISEMEKERNVLCTHTHTYMREKGGGGGEEEEKQKEADNEKILYVSSQSHIAHGHPWLR